MSGAMLEALAALDVMQDAAAKADSTNCTPAQSRNEWARYDAAEKIVRAALTPPEAAQAEAVARDFHDTYERLAPSFGYETRPDTKQFDPETPNARLMVAVCGEVMARTTPPNTVPVESLRELVESAIGDEDRHGERIWCFYEPDWLKLLQLVGGEQS